MHIISRVPGRPLLPADHCPGKTGRISAAETARDSDENWWDDHNVTTNIGERMRKSRMLMKPLLGRLNLTSLRISVLWNPTKIVLFIHVKPTLLYSIKVHESWLLFCWCFFYKDSSSARILRDGCAVFVIGKEVSEDASTVIMHLIGYYRLDSLYRCFSIALKYSLHSNQNTW